MQLCDSCRVAHTHNEPTPEAEFTVCEYCLLEKGCSDIPPEKIQWKEDNSPSGGKKKD